MNNSPENLFGHHCAVIERQKESHNSLVVHQIKDRIDGWIVYWWQDDEDHSNRVTREEEHPLPKRHRILLSPPPLRCRTRRGVEKGLTVIYGIIWMDDSIYYAVPKLIFAFTTTGFISTPHVSARGVVG